MTISIDTLELKHGSHNSRDDGLCVMEAVAWLAGEQHSDHPQCASPVITSFAMGLNDTWDDDARQRLIPYTKLIVNTRDGLDDQRALMVFDWDAAWAAAGDAAGAALRPTVVELQDSALDLLDRMCRLGEER